MHDLVGSLFLIAMLVVSLRFLVTGIKARQTITKGGLTLREADNPPLFWFHMLLWCAVLTFAVTIAISVWLS